MKHNFVQQPSRRHVLRSLVGGSLLLPGIVSDLFAADGAAGAASPGAVIPRPSHFVPKAKRVIFLYMSGGVSHVDSFDPKPRLFADHGKNLSSGRGSRVAKGPNWEFRPRGKSGIEISDLFPHVAECVDDLCVVRSMKTDHGDHFEATLGIHTGSVTVTRPSIGAWVSYGLGTLNQNLPSFVVLAPKLPYAGGQVWGSDFLPASHQGTRVLPGSDPIANLTRRSPSHLQQMELGLLQSFNKNHLLTRDNDPALAARIRSFETAAGMQQEAPDAFDLTKETDATLALYGLERGSTKGFAWQCLVARRLVERGVRFVELIDIGSSNNWDAHGDMKTHEPLARNVDRPIAGLLKDLKSRGMLEDTLVVWTTEFGRTPFTDGPKGRSHQNSAFSSWLAGGGAKGGIAYGKTDDYAAKVVEN